MTELEDLAAGLRRLMESAVTFETQQIGPHTLYRGDCLEILPTLGRVDAVVTDPPYGIGASTGVGKYGERKWLERRGGAADLAWDGEAPAERTMAALVALSGEVIVWGGNYMPLPPARCFLVWDKGAGFRNRSFAECEQAWANLDMNARIIVRDPLASGDYKGKVHPTQKPIAVMEWCIGFIKGRTILDPFMGSGTTIVAAHNLGRVGIGIELEPKYFDIACKRVEQAVAQQSLFTEKPAKPIQEGFLP